MPPRVGLLSTVDAPLLGYLLRELDAHGVPVSAIIADSAGVSERDRALHEERTGGRLPAIPPEDLQPSGIPFYFVRRHGARSTARLVRELRLDLLLNAGTPRILGPTMIAAPTIGILNCHPGLLPRFRGCTCVEWAVYLDDQVGNTVHFMTEEIDDGPIVVQEALTFARSDSYVDVRVKVYEHGNALLAHATRKVIDEGLRPESLARSGEGRYFNVIDAAKMAEVLDKLARGMYAYQR